MKVGEGADALHQPAEQGRVDRVAALFQLREHGQARAELREVAGARGTQCDAGEDTLDIADVAKPGAYRFVPRAVDQRAQGLEPQAQGFPPAQGAQQPAPQQPASHRGRAAIEHPGQRPAVIPGEALGELQIALRDPVEHHRIALPFQSDGTDVGEGAALGLARVMQQAARRRHRGVLPVQAEAAQVEGAELPAQQPVRAVGVEVPGRYRAQRHALPRHRGGQADRFADQQLSRPDALQLCAQCFLAAGFEARKTPGAEIEHGEAEAVAVRMHRHQRRLPVPVEQRLVGHRTGGDDARHLPLDRPPACRGVADLLAYRGTFSPADEPGEVGVHRMGRYPGHRDRLALVAAAHGERDVEERRRTAGVFEEELVEVAHAVEEQHVGMLRLDTQVLLHDRAVAGSAAPGGGGTCGLAGGGVGRRVRRRGGGSLGHRPSKCTRARGTA